MSFLFSILSSSVLKNISAIPMIVGISAGSHSPVLISTAIPIIIPAIPRKIPSLPMIYFVEFS